LELLTKGLRPMESSKRNHGKEEGSARGWRAMGAIRSGGDNKVSRRVGDRSWDSGVKTWVEGERPKEKRCRTPTGEKKKKLSEKPQKGGRKWKKVSPPDLMEMQGKERERLSCRR